MSDIRNNKILSVFCDAMRGTALLCVTGPIMQTFLASLGFPSQFLYFHNTLVQIANVVTIMLFSQWGNRGNIIKRVAILEIPHALLYLLYIPLCLWKSPSFGSFAAITGICMLQTICIGLYTVCEYKLPYYIYRAQDYGSIIAVCGISASIFSFLTGTLITYLSGILSYSQLMLGACCVSTLLMLGTAFLHSRLKVISSEVSFDTPSAAPSKVSTRQLLRYPIFYRMIPANLFRGFAYGATTVMAAIALDLGFDTGVSTALVSVQSAAQFIGCAIFGVAVVRLSPRLISLIGCLPFALIPLMLFPNKFLFLAVFGLMMLGRTLVDYSVPSVLRYAVPLEIAGPYNAWRMLLHYGGTLAASTVAAFIPVQALLILAMLCQFFAGITYFSDKTLAIKE